MYIRILNYLIDRLEKLRDRLKYTPRGISAKEWAATKKVTRKDI